MVRRKKNRVFYLIILVSVAFVYYFRFTKQVIKKNSPERVEELDFQFETKKRNLKNELIQKNKLLKYKPKIITKLKYEFYDFLPFYHKFNRYNPIYHSFREDENLFTFANLNKNKSLKLGIKDMRGINNETQKLYEPNEKGMFKCLTNNQFIDFDKLNDDYCDCLDESDEPSTNACQFGKFYCSFQNKLLLNYHIPSSRVDDKICDCCDGSDENSESKCINTCESLISKLKNQAKERNPDLIEKKNYSTNEMKVDENLYGPLGVFSKLKKKCYKISSSETLYKVCPYRKITQRRSKKIITIGRVPSLVKKSSNHWILKMNGGDNYHNKPRASEIYLICGSTDEITSVQEPQKNFFVFSIKTPDACS